MNNRLYDDPLGKQMLRILLSLRHNLNVLTSVDIDLLWAIFLPSLATNVAAFPQLASKVHTEAIQFGNSKPRASVQS